VLEAEHDPAIERNAERVGAATCEFTSDELLRDSVD
jgi:hypothetical protein